MNKLTKGVLSNTFAQRALHHQDGSVTHPQAKTGQDVNPNATVDNNATLDVTAPVLPPPSSDM